MLDRGRHCWVDTGYRKMQPDVTELLDFYARPLGGMVRRILVHRIRARWRSTTGATVAGLGFATPYLAPFRGEAARVMALMPITQGAVVWPQVGPAMTVVVEDDHLPLPDNSIDYLLVVHCLEASERVRGMLREIWRVLKPEGRVILVVPNRRGVWARLDTTPFGHGRPFSTGQLERLLSDAMFTVIEWSSALYMPPFDRRVVLRSALSLERIGGRLSPAFAGVIIVEAKKELVTPLADTEPARGLRVLVPARNSSFESVEPAKPLKVGAEREACPDLPPQALTKE